MTTSSNDRSTSGDAALVVLSVLAVLGVLYFAKTALLPIVLGVLLSLLFRGPVGWLHRRRIPRSVGAALAILATLSLVTGGLIRLAEPAASWLDRAPRTFQRLERELRSLRGSVEEMSRAAEQVKEMTDLQAAGSRTPKVQVEERSASDLLLGQAALIGSTLTVVLFLVFMLLVFGDDLLEQTLLLLPDSAHRHGARAIASDIEREVSSYLSTITGINVGLGLLVALATYLVGLPSPLLWGAMAALLNFVPYLGGLTGVAIVGVVAITTVEPTSRALLAPLLYGGLTALEGMLITPVIVGRRFALNPLIVFLWLLLWGWLWQIAGMLIAIPLLTILKVLVDRIPSWKRFAPVLARRRVPTD